MARSEQSVMSVHSLLRPEWRSQKGGAEENIAEHLKGIVLSRLLYAPVTFSSCRDIANANASTIGAAPVKDNVFVLSLLGAFLTLSGALSNWWAARFASNYRGSYEVLSAAFAVATVVLVAVALWAKLSKSRGGSR
jgi:hypothetical protein